MHRHRLLALALAVPAVLAVGCDADHNDSGNDIADWVATASQKVDADAPTDADLPLDADADCPLVDELRYDGDALEPAGAGSAVYGEDHRRGLRFQCAFGSADGPALVRVEVVLLDDDGEYAAYADLVNGRDDQATSTIDGHEVVTAPDPDEDDAIDAELLLPVNRAAIHLLLEADGATADDATALLTDALST